MRHRSRNASIAIATAIAALGLATPALAASTPAKSVSDSPTDAKTWSKVGDVPVKYHRAGEITQVTYSTDNTRLYIKFRVKNVLPVTKSHSQEYMIVAHARKSTRGYFEFRGRLGRAPQYSSNKSCPATADRMTYSTSENWVLFSVPKSCLPNVDTLHEISGSVTSNFQSGDRRWSTEDSTRWVPYRVR